jgi:hypothetical protein
MEAMKDVSIEDIKTILFHKLEMVNLSLKAAQDSYSYAKWYQFRQREIAKRAINGYTDQKRLLESIINLVA